MATILFTDGWTFSREGDEGGIAVRLPHDAMIGEPRSPAADTGNHGGFFPGGSYSYRKEWRVPADVKERHYRLFFEAVYGNTIVTVDGVEAARCNNGYFSFVAPLTGLTPGSWVTIEVLVDNTEVPNSRWYTGSGIYRRVWLESVSKTHIARDGVQLITRSLSSIAEVDVELCIEGDSERCEAELELCDGDSVVASATVCLVNGKGLATLQVPAPRPWSAEDPYLYTVSVAVVIDGNTMDERHIRTGLRTIELDAQEGLRINGKQVFLRGACVHSDNGILGAISLPASEYRRACILKESGYNAVRASHNPMSRAFLDACDEVGLYVVDELTDVWFQHKTKHDTADRFEDNWRKDAKAMICENRNRPSVIMYSIGNEIAETATERGVKTAAKIHAFIRDLDPTRPTTLAINLLLNMMASGGKSPFESEKYTGDSVVKKKKETTSTAANFLTARLGRIMGIISRLPAADRVSRDAFAEVDVAGYNYAFGRYAGDRKKYPQRVILGSESMPGDLPAIWKRVTSVPGVIGDFMWTGWDYLGEAGLGTWSYGDQPGGINKPYPALLAGSGAIDITGFPGAPTLLAKAVWGLLDAPAIAVRPLSESDRRANKTPWRSSDAISSWSWNGVSGKASIEVYCADDHVELLLNNRCLGRKRAGIRVGFITRFTVPYERGELVAIAYRAGRETGRSSLVTAATPFLQLRPECRILSGEDGLAHVWVEFADENGIVDAMANDEVVISIEGPAELAGFGSAAPITEDAYTGDTATTYFGRALAILRPTSTTGFVSVTAKSERYGIAETRLEITGSSW